MLWDWTRLLVTGVERKGDALQPCWKKLKAPETEAEIPTGLAGWQSPRTDGVLVLDVPQTHHKARSAPKIACCSKGDSKFSSVTP